METNKPHFIKRQPIVSGKEYASLLASLKERYRRMQIKTAVKVNSSLLEYYWLLGRDISRLHATAEWGSAFFDSLSLDLKTEFPNQTGFSAANLRYAKRWYEFYNQDDTILQQVVEEIRQQVVDEFSHQLGDELEMPLDFGLIPWGHHIFIFTHSKTVAEALFYIEQTIQGSWSRAELEAKIASGLYLHQSKAITNFNDKLPAPHSGLAQAILKSPYDFGFVDRQIHSERQLEDELEKNITRLLLELGNGFAYVGRQMELRMPGGQTFIPDMIFYHTRLKCYIVLELKIVPFIPDFAGQLNFYVTAVDELMKQDDDNPTIGLLICKSKDDTVVEWSFRGIERPLGVAQYSLNKEIEKIAEMLPSESEIRNMLDTYDEV